ncbi:MAG TPA: hypothetical protein VFV07_00720 [Rhizomicrobium sp.]|nr:hypothetical protein [Rhizomicrobium sp.]
MRDEQKAARWQDYFQWALGMPSRGARPLETARSVQPVSIVSDVSKADLPDRGSYIVDRYLNNLAVAGTHSYVEILPNPRYGIMLHAVTLNGVNVAQGVQLSNSLGAGGANRAEQNVEALGNVSQWGPRTGDGSQFPGPEFAGWTLGPQRVMPYRVFFGTCGQRGPYLMEDATLGFLSHLELARPIVTYGAPLIFIARLAQAQLDISLFLEIPMRGEQAMEGF